MLELIHNKRSNHFIQLVKIPIYSTRWIIYSFTFLVCIFLTLSNTEFALAQDSTMKNLKGMSLEDLVNIEVTSVSKKSEKLNKAAAAIFVITQEDIKRSGFKSLPEALRLAPGVHVARVDGNKWAITARGFNGAFANKLLVLVDGRSIYTPLFSGVYWDAYDFIMDDIDRIEVIRGPGATLWGANAVNGVINIITKDASETTGYLANASYESNENIKGGLRYGVEISEDTHLRIFSKYSDFNGYNGISGTKLNDDLKDIRTGFRLDHKHSDKDKLFLIGGYSQGTSAQTFNFRHLTPPYATSTINEDSKITGGDISGKWTRQMSPTSEFTSMIYYEHTSRKSSYSNEERANISLDFQYSFEAYNNLYIIMGIGHHQSQDKTKANLEIEFYT